MAEPVNIMEKVKKMKRKKKGGTENVKTKLKEMATGGDRVHMR